MSQRSVLVGTAVALAIVLAGLLLYLWWLSLPADMTEKGGKPSDGIAPQVAIYGPGEGDAPKLDGPMGVAWSPDGKRIYVADTGNNRIVVFERSGRFSMTFGSFGVAKPLPGYEMTWDPGELNYPTDVATDEDGNVYVADFQNESISVFDSKGSFVRRFPDPLARVGRGTSGRGGTGIAVTALTVQGDLVYATDRYQIVVFDKRGRFIRQFGKPGVGPGDLDHPGGVAVDSQGRVYVSDSNHNRVEAFSSEGDLIWVTGRQISDLSSETANPFVLPRGLTIQRDGSIVVADPLGQELVVLDRSGARLQSLGVRGSVPGQLNFPTDVAVFDEDIAIADRENDRVQVVRLVSP
jgi:sugar lactone lactonase YvrE